jgi:invasion protein IalB
MRINPVFLASLLVIAGGSAASAQQRTSATYDDWTVRCEMRDQNKSCEMVQLVQVQGQQAPIAQIAIGRLNKNEPLRIVFQLPINVWLPSGVKFVSDDKDPGVAGAFKRCVSNSCFADADIKEDNIKKWRSLNEAGKLQFKDAGQQDINIPVSFKGLGQAYDAMQKQ